MKELSQLLKSERLKQGLSLKAASERAHVSINVLEALENEQYEQIGTPLLIRSFIKAYCSALGIDPIPLLEQYENDIRSYDRQDEGIKRYGVWVKALHKRGRKGVLLVLVLVLGVVVALYGGTWLSKTKARLSGGPGTVGGIYSQQELPPDLRETTPAPPPAQSDAKKDLKKDVPAVSEDTPKPLPDASAAKAEKPDAPAVVGKAADSSAPKAGAESANPAEVLVDDKPKSEQPQEVSSTHHLTMEATQKTWIQVKVDGKKVQKGMLHPGEKREWDAENNVQLVVGNGGGVTIKWDGKQVGTGARSGRILRLHLSGAESSKKTGTP